MRNKATVYCQIKNYLVITLGCVLYAISVNWLFQPNNIVMGGATGVAQIVNHFVPALPVGLMIIVINIPLFILGIRIQGFKILISSLYSMLIGSVLIDLFDIWFAFPPIENTLVACLFGGVLLDVSLGMQLMAGATNGGTDLAARLLKYRLPHVSIGKLCLFMDAIVVCGYALAFRSVEAGLYGVLTMYVCSVALDTVVYGGTQAKMAFIISPKSEEIRKTLLELELGVTVLDGRGGWNQNRTDVLLCAFRQARIAAIKSAVMECDPNAFLIVSDTHEILGEGFGVYSKDAL